jgi:phosphoglycolate phosphatase-like HAD superfamily hydrolase
MMTDKDPARELKEFRSHHDFLVAIDSDGCAFDTMEIKHKECFIPNTIRCFGLQAVARYAREAAEFVNLYSKWRGINRFPALIRTLDLLRERREVAERSVSVPYLPATRAWLSTEAKPGNPALRAAIETARSPERDELQRVLSWSEAVNATVANIVEGVPPYPFVRECTQRASTRADIIVVSATPGEALRREWAEHDLARYVAVIAGQEMGTKAEHLRLTSSKRYEPDRVLMIGDAPGDLEAAKANDVLFYPIKPGDEADSWKQLFDGALDRFLKGQYGGQYEAAQIADFQALLPDAPPWQH